MIRVPSLGFIVLIIACSRPQPSTESKPISIDSNSVSSTHKEVIEPIDSLVKYLQLAGCSFQDTIYAVDGLKNIKGQILSYFIRTNEKVLREKVTSDKLYSFRSKVQAAIYIRQWQFVDQESAHFIANRLSEKSDGDGIPFKEPHVVYVVNATALLVFVDAEYFRSEINEIAKLPVPSAWQRYEDR